MSSRRRPLDRLAPVVDAIALFVGCLANALTARLTRVVGRDESRWVFGARLGEGFTDNARYCFAYADERPEVRAVWLSRDEATVERVRAAGYEAYHARSLRGRWQALRAGCVVVTHGLRDVSLAWTGGAYVANLWHGVPLKTIGFDAEIGDRPWPVRRASRYVATRSDLVVVPSPMAVHEMATGLGVPRDRVRVLPYPRYDPLVAPEAPESADALAGESDDGDGSTAAPDSDANGAAVERLAALADDGPVVCYLPTFREQGADLGARVDFAALDRLLAAEGARLVVKPHPNERLSLPTGLDRITALGDVGDLSTLLRYTDVLVTDYSSVFVDYLLLDRPMVFYAPDLEEYRSERGFYYDYEALVPGPVVRDDDGLRRALGRALTDDPFAGRRRALREAFLVEPGDHPSRRVFETVRSELRNDAPGST